MKKYKIKNEEGDAGPEARGGQKLLPLYRNSKLTTNFELVKKERQRW
ncbi:MAG: hypothetical protein HDS00_02585 [Bacteroides sp.]|nr:hypothetical protein [Bacteroides sp.]